MQKETSTNKKGIKKMKKADMELFAREHEIRRKIEKETRESQKDISTWNMARLKSTSMLVASSSDTN